MTHQNISVLIGIIHVPIIKIKSPKQKRVTFYKTTPFYFPCPPKRSEGGSLFTSTQLPYPQEPYPYQAYWYI